MVENPSRAAAPKGERGISLNIVLHGAESTGKSTLARQLAAHYDAPFVHEYGRTYCEAYGTDLMQDDLVKIMRGHMELTAEVRKQACALFFSDTDPLMTAAWQMMMFASRHPDLDAFTDVGDLYLLMDDDLPWIDDGLRVHKSAAERAHFQALSKAELDRRGVPYAVISGDGEARKLKAIAVIDQMLAARRDR